MRNSVRNLERLKAALIEAAAANAPEGTPSTASIHAENAERTQVATATQLSPHNTLRQQSLKVMTYSLARETSQGRR